MVKEVLQTPQQKNPPQCNFFGCWKMETPQPRNRQDNHSNVRGNLSSRDRIYLSVFVDTFAFDRPIPERVDWNTGEHNCEGSSHPPSDDDKPSDGCDCSKPLNGKHATVKEQKGQARCGYGTGKNDLSFIVNLNRGISHARRSRKRNTDQQKFFHVVEAEHQLMFSKAELKSCPVYQVKNLQIHIYRNYIPISSFALRP